jgi:hypothetical protein
MSRIAPAACAGWTRTKIVFGKRRSSRISATPLEQGKRLSQVPKSHAADRSLTPKQPPMAYI